MSEIFAPGSVAGPQGPAGAAGSLANVKSLTDNVLPNMGNLFDSTRVTVGSTINSDGTVAANAGWHLSPMIYCAGATSGITTIPFRTGSNGVGWFALYDANGTFLSTLDTTAFGSAWGSFGTINADQVFPLPGTQTYVRFSYVASDFSNNGFPASESVGSFYASVGTPAIPGTFQPFGFDTVADVNAKDAVVAANAATGLAAALTSTAATLVTYALPGAPLNQRNLFNVQNVVRNHSVYSDGTFYSYSGFNAATVYCPEATSYTSNIPMWIGTSPSEFSVVALDAHCNFLGDLTGNYTGGMVVFGSTVPGTYSLPGTQTYLRFTYNGHWASGAWPNSENGAAFYAGTVASPPPSSITVAPSFVGNPPLSVRFASSFTSADLSFDATAAFNLFLATASSTNPVKLVFDGMFNTSGLVISPNGYSMIEGLGAGTGINANGPQDGIRIGAYVSGSGDSEGAYNITAPARSSVNIVLRDFTVNAAGQTNATANQPVTGAVAHATYPIILANASGICIDNLNFPTAGGAYCITLTNVDHARVTNCVFDTSGYVHDGVHIDGPANDIGIDNCDFTTGDDAIALNAPEGYGGDISRVSIANCRFYNALSVMRIYTSLDPAAMPSNNVHKIRNVTVSNCSGVISNICFVLGIEGGGLTSTSDVDQIQDLSISNCTFTAPFNLIRVRDNMGAIALNGVKFIPTSTNPIFDMQYGTGELSLDDFTVLRNPDGNSACDVVAVASGSSIDRLSLLHCRVVDQEGTSYTAMSSWVNNGGTVSALRLEAVDMTHVAALTAGSSFTGITTVSGTGVLGTGAQVPDASMDSDAFYLSSTASGAVSIKVGGTAKRVTLT